MIILVIIIPRLFLYLHIRKLLEVVHGEKPSFGVTGATSGVGGATNESVIDVS